MRIHHLNSILTFNRKLFLSVIALFLAFVLCFVAFQYRREKDYKVEILNTRLQHYNDRMMEFVSENGISNMLSLNEYVQSHHLENMRTTIIDEKGNVMYDNLREDLHAFRNHSDRQEVKQALNEGSGYSIRRLSESIGENFFYSARYYPELGLIVRTALPYSVDLSEHLKIDKHYIGFAVVISLILILVFYQFTHKLGMSINQLQQFVMKADRNESFETDVRKVFPKNELGEISQHIIQIYHRLHQTKEELYKEREKLITHLQISHEGLGIFTFGKKEILVNNLFTQYMNQISDKNLSKTEEIFSIAELSPISDFIEKSPHESHSNEVKRKSLEVEKNGRIFTIECIIFQDNTFEISINDITQDTEKSRLKKQLTQNIAHELKTPVSSIKGYLETLINNPDIPKDKVDAFLERSYAQSERLTHLLRDISVLTQMEEVPHVMTKSHIRIFDKMQKILDEVAMELEEKQIKVKNLLNKDLIIQGDASLLYSVFRNLTDNAIAYAGTGIEISVRNFREDEKYHYFSFADTGVGVPDEHLTRLFERFYRVDKGRSRKLGGTGLGLAIVKNAILLHGGSIFAKNNPDGGLEFIFTLSKE